MPNNKPDLSEKVMRLERRVVLLEERLSAMAEGMVQHRDACLTHFLSKTDHARDLQLMRDIMAHLKTALDRLEP